MKTSLATSAIVLLCVVTAIVSAAPIEYGDFSGVTIDFLDVTENSITDALPLFGPPTVSVNSIDFDPVNFGAQAVNGATDITDGLLQMTIMAKPNFGILEIQLDEAGDYTLGGLPAAFAHAEVNSAVFAKVIEADIDGDGDGDPITPVEFDTNMTFVPGNGSYSRPGDDGIGVIWSGSVSIDVDQLLADNGVLGVATKLELSIDNTLTAAAENEAVAFIQKKDFGGLGITVIVPEPSSVALGLISLISIGVVTAFRSQAPPKVGP